MTIRSQRLITGIQLGPLLRGARKSLKLTQAQLARRVGLSQRRISEFELDPNALSVAQLLTICNQLGLQVVIQQKETHLQEPDPHQGEW